MKKTRKRNPLSSLPPALIVVLVGVSAGWAQWLFGALIAFFTKPIRGLLFAMKMMLREVSVKTKVPVAIRTAIAICMGWVFFGVCPAFLIPELKILLSHLLAPLSVVSYFGVGIVIGTGSAIYVHSVYFLEDIFGREIPGNYYLRHMAGMLLAAAIAGGSPVLGYGAMEPVNVTVDLTAGPVNTFTPGAALGAAVDGHSRGDSAAIYREATVRAMRSAGLHSISYRLRTELAIEAWHWNPQGHWSDSDHRRGYWTSDDRPGAPILASYGYRLPRRGSTIDQAEDNGYSRLADGDLNTFWKSNPYLDNRYTGEENSRHPQWIIADLGKRTPVNAIRIAWGIPYAVRYRVEYWEGEDPDDPEAHPDGRWQAFLSGESIEGRGGDVILRLAPDPVPTRFLRVLMQESSATAPLGEKDPRDALGYAVREMFIGTQDAGGRFRDVVRHSASRDGQTRFFVSSTDPWHRACDLDPEVEQAGLDLVFASGITQGLPLLVPVGVLYDTPDNAAALMRYLIRRGYPVRGIELGEEPDGQYVAPEDYGTLYLQAADALRAVSPAVVPGGPSLESQRDESMMAWSGTEVVPDNPWLKRLLGYLEGRRRSSELGFLSFEWYPVDDVSRPPAPLLCQLPALLTNYLANLYEQGLPGGTPIFMTEYGYSAFSSEVEVDLAGALFNADVVGTFLTVARTPGAAYMYGLEPTPLYKGPGRGAWGNNTMFLSDDQRHILARTATYHCATMLTRQWAGNPAQPHRVYPVRVDLDAPGGNRSLTAYAVQRPDGLWAVLLVNKDPVRARTVALRFAGPKAGTATSLEGPCDLYQFSGAQYRWRADGAKGRPAFSRHPAHTVWPAGAPSFRLPPWSLTVIRGAVKSEQ